MRLALTTCLVAVQACGLLDPDGYNELGSIVWDGDTASITMPDTVVAGESFNIVVQTWGHGCTRRTDRAVVAVGADTVEVLPYDWHSTGVVCLSDPRFPLYHDVSLRFDRPGHATVRIHGRQFDEGSMTQELQLDHQLVVR